MIFLSDLATPEGRAAASAKSKSMDKDPLVYDLFAVRHASDKGSTTTASHQPPFLWTVQVIIHRGTAFQGHYFAYIRDTTGNNFPAPCCGHCTGNNSSHHKNWGL